MKHRIWINSTLIEHTYIIPFNKKFSENFTGNFRSSYSETKLFLKFANFPRKSFVGGLWNLKLVYCKEKPLKQLFWKTRNLIKLYRVPDHLFKTCIFTDRGDIFRSSYIWRESRQETQATTQTTHSITSIKEK